MKISSWVSSNCCFVFFFREGFKFLFRLQVLAFVVFADFFFESLFKAGLYIELYLMSNNDSLGQIVMKLIFYDFKVATLMTTFTFYESLLDKNPGST